MPKLSNTKTHDNLKHAFAGESQANRRYMYFARRADIEGYPEIGGLFRDTAEAETGHAFGHLDFLKEVGDPATGFAIGGTNDNLKSAVEGETGHAHCHLEYLRAVGDPATGEPIGNSEKNLKAAIAGETYEYTKMYPGFAKTAREEGFEEIAEWFETLARAEKSHAGRFQKGLDNLGKF